LFPTSRAISEPLQIGRTNAIDQLLAWALAGTSVLLLEERRIGKSSVALAVLDRIRNAGDGTLALHADLRDGVGDSVALVRKLLDQAATQDAGGRITALELFEPGARLDFVGERYELPVITLEAWQEGLQTRFRQAGYDISPEQIAQIYLETDGHPQLTMSACAHTILWADDAEATAITPAIVRRAITAAKKHPSRVGS
jgi:hypothetical protein